MNVMRHLKTNILILCLVFAIVSIASVYLLSVKSVVESTALIVNRSDSRWQERKLSTDELLMDIKFTSSKVGWVADHSKVFVTQNGGMSWGENYLPIKSDFKITSLAALNDREAWVSVCKPSQVYTDIENDLSYLLSTKDGGKSWEIKYYFIRARIESIVYDENHFLWVLGANFHDLPHWHQRYLTIRINLKTDELLNLSDKLIKVRPCDKASDYIVDASITGVKSLVLLSVNGEIFHSDNNGMTWNIDSLIITNESPPACRIITSHQDQMVVFCADNDHGIVSSIVETNNGKRGKIFFNTFLLLDVRKLPDGTTVVCGSTPSADDAFYPLFGRDGIVLETVNGRSEWSLIHKSQQAEIFSSMCISPDNILWVSGGNGVVASRPL